MPRASQQEPEELDESAFLRPANRPVAAKPSSKKKIADPDSDIIENDAAESDKPFLRAKRRPAVRKQGVQVRAARALVWFAAVLLLAIVVLSATAVRSYALHAKRFVVVSSSSVETEPMKNVSRAQVLDVFGADLGRNIFYVPLEQRRKQLQQIPWVRSATVMRLLPSRLRVTVSERTPIAFAQLGGTTALIDAEGTLMGMPRTGEKYDFPVITGFSTAEITSVRAARMSIYQQLVHELDADNAHYSRDLSEVDLSDPKDVRVVVSDASGPVLVHFGDSDFQHKYRFYLDHIAAWRQQYQVRSVDLRYDGQVIVNREGQNQ
ncbi:MAG: FtsQ-type POTRA domain-containing protein [Acidobacteriales bacterium]|nr:FtsQ-type POTRA domain-containing protein [Terriglobales bacterium]